MRAGASASAGRGTMTAAKPGLRGLVRDLHLYLSLAVGLFVVAIALTGAPLVWRDSVDRLLNPARYAVSGGDVRLPMSAYAANALAAAGPEFGLLELRLPAESGWPVQASLRAPAKDGAPARSLVATLDPATGKALDVFNFSATFVGVLHNFHHMLMVPQWSGRQIVGWIGVVLLILALSGLYLWWPRNASFALGLRWGRSPWVTSNLHQFAGFWLSIPLAVVAATGVYLAFPNAAYRLTSSMAAASQPMRHGGHSALPARNLRLDADGALAMALALEPGAQPRAVVFPSVPRGGHDHAHTQAGGGPWRILLRTKNASGPVSILVDDATGAARRADAPLPGDSAAQLLKGLHEARRGGPAWAVLVFLAGLAPAAFLFTGVVMWLRRRSRRASLDARRAAAARA